MKPLAAVHVHILWTLVVGAASLSGQEKQLPAERSEERVVPYDSKSHGALEVKSVSAAPVDFFDVFQNGKRAFAGNPKLLNSVLELPPGAYVVDVNRTQRKVRIHPGRKSILQSGELVVRGKPSTAFWYPVQGREQKVVGNPPLLNRPRALFAGTYTAVIHGSTSQPAERRGPVQVVAGKQTVLRR